MIPNSYTSQIKHLQQTRYKDIESFVSYLIRVTDYNKTTGLCAIIAGEFEGFIKYQKELGNIPKEEIIKVYVTFNPLQEFVVKFNYQNGAVKLLTI